MSTLKTNNIQHVDRSDPSIVINTDGSVNIAGTMTYEDVTNVDAVGIITGRSNIDAQKQVHVGTGVSVKAGGLNVTAGITTVQALQATTGTFTGDVTVTGTTPSILLTDTDNNPDYLIKNGNGEFNIQDATASTNRLSINSSGNVVVGSDLIIPDKIVHSGDTNTTVRFPAADTITAETGGSERLRIASDGQTTFDKGSPGSSNQVISRFQAESSRRLDIVWHDSGSLMGFDTPSSHAYIFKIGGSEKLRIASGGNLLLGTTTAAVSAGRAIMLAAADGARIKLCDSDEGVTASDGFEIIASNNGTAYVWNRENMPLLFGTNNTERFQVTSGGVVVVGHNAATTSGATNNSNFNIVGNIGSATGEGQLNLWRRAGNPSADDVLGQINFCGDSSGDPGAVIKGECDLAWDQGGDASDHAGRLTFFTVPDNSSVAVERMRITSSGNVTAAGIVTATEFVATSIPTGGRKNLVINGDMRIAQRGTAAVTVTTSAKYRTVDRWKTDIDGSGGGDFSHEQSTDVPTGQGFSHSSKCTVTTQASQPTAESVHHQLYSMFEKQDVHHLEWGTSNAKTVTLSFWVKSSVAGTYAFWFAFYGGSNYYYWTNYTINSANTWEKKTITVTGPTSGGNVTAGSNANGFRIEWTLGTGSDSETGTLNTWTTSGTFRTASGTVYLPENSGATWYLTGVQLEVGSNASAYEFRSYGEELALCQRYFEKTYAQGTALGNASNFSGSYTSRDGTASSVARYYPFSYKITKRATPDITIYNPSTGATGECRLDSGSYSATASSQNDSAVMIYSNTGSPPSHYGIFFHLALDAEL